MGLLDNIANQVKNDLTWKASSKINEGISNVIDGDKNEEKSNKCPKCSKAIEDSGLKFCPNCGTKLLNTCTKCTIDYPLDVKFCTQCGGALN